MEGGVEQGATANSANHGNGNGLVPSKRRACTLLRPAPPLTPLERFLSGSFHGGNTSTTADISRKRLPLKKAKQVQSADVVPPPLFACPNAIRSGTGGVPSGLSSNESGFVVNRLLSTNEEAPHIHADSKEIARLLQSCKDGKKLKSSSSSSSLIKGQWTTEEDSLLVRLVRQHGVRKWSQIAKMLVGRIGKQCRERWHNHLRPDIKKDSWTEEEELLLVRAHEKLGNKWAEIAKRIPGRTENSIKNHWNATKRRQNSRRKTKKKIDQEQLKSLQQPSILQDYIRSVTTTTTVSVPTMIDTDITSPDLCSPSEASSPVLFQSMLQEAPEELVFAYDSSASTTTHDFYEAGYGQPYYYDMVFGESFGADHSNGHLIQDPQSAESLDFLDLDNDCQLFLIMEEEGCPPSLETSSQAQGYDLHGKLAVPSSSSTDFSTNTSASNSGSVLSSDLYLSYLLNGDQIPSGELEQGLDMDLMKDQGSSRASSLVSKRELDLMEMISVKTNQSSPGNSCNTSFL